MKEIFKVLSTELGVHWVLSTSPSWRNQLLVFGNCIKLIKKQLKIVKTDLKNTIMLFFFLLRKVVSSFS